MLAARTSLPYITGAYRTQPLLLAKANFASATKQLQKGGSPAGKAETPKDDKPKKVAVLKQKKPPPKKIYSIRHQVGNVGRSTESIQKAIDRIKADLGKPVPTVNPRWVWLVLNQGKITEEQRETLFNMVREGVPLYKRPGIIKRQEKRLPKQQAWEASKASEKTATAETIAQTTTIAAETAPIAAETAPVGSTSVDVPKPETNVEAAKSENKEAQTPESTSERPLVDLSKPYWYKAKADHKKELHRLKLQPKEFDPNSIDDSADGMYRVFPKKEQRVLTPKSPKVRASDQPTNLIQESFLYKKMITWYLSKQKWDKVQDIVQKMKADKNVDRHAYYYMLRNALEHAPERVEPIMQDMKGVGIPIDQHVYARYIEFYDHKNDEENMLSTFAKMNTENIIPTEQSYSRLVARYIRKGEFDKALEAHKEMGAKGVKLNAFILPAFLDAYTAKTLPDNVYEAFIGEIRAQPGAFLVLARKLANKIDKPKLAALDEIQQKMHFGGQFRHEWQNNTRIRQNMLARWKEKQEKKE